MATTSSNSQDKVETVLICSWLEAEYVDRIRNCVPRHRVEYHPHLLPQPRYSADHTGVPRPLSPAEEQRWMNLLREATILFDFDRKNLSRLPRLAPRVRWIQATSAGIGELMRRYDLPRQMPQTVVTTASGVHIRPLSEFAAMSMMMHSRRMFETLRAQRDHRWERFAGTDLEGRTVLIVGLGSIGEVIARIAKTLGMRVLGIRRSASPDSRSGSAEVYPPQRLPELLPSADFLVLIAPLTDQTRGMIGPRELALLPPGAALINIGRGALVDERALLEALQGGHLGGAYLDVFKEEPLPPESPLWEMPNVLVSPHSGSTSDRENRRLTDLFCENLKRWQARKPLQNVFDPTLGY